MIKFSRTEISERDLGIVIVNQRLIRSNSKGLVKADLPLLITEAVMGWMLTTDLRWGNPKSPVFRRKFQNPPPPPDGRCTIDGNRSRTRRKWLLQSRDKI
ncbi:hypothetical protein U1Q18_022321 [Sarracenia purpurea var. burkii]